MSADSISATVMFAAYYHPQTIVRECLRTRISDWVKACRPMVKEDGIRQALSTVRGTPLEPFVLHPEDVDIAVDLIRIAFSRRHKQTRFRLVSRETLGTDGGCVITSNLKSFYVERFAFGQHKKTPRLPWHFAPSVMPDTEKGRGAYLANVKAEIQVTKSGYVLRISDLPVSEFSGVLTQAVPAQPRRYRQHGHRLIYDLSRTLREESTVGDKGITLDQLGCRVNVHDNAIDVATTSPEAMIKLTAYMSRGDRLDLRFSTEDSPARVVVWLEPPKKKVSQLRAMATAIEGPFRDWVGIRPSQLPRLEIEDMIEISQWLGPHRTWANESFFAYL